MGSQQSPPAGHHPHVGSDLTLGRAAGACAFISLFPEDLWMPLTISTASWLIPSVPSTRDPGSRNPVPLPAPAPVTNLKKLINFAKVDSLLGIQLVDVTDISIHQIETKAHHLERERGQVRHPHRTPGVAKKHGGSVTHVHTRVRARANSPACTLFQNRNPSPNENRKHVPNFNKKVSLLLQWPLWASSWG